MEIIRRRSAARRSPCARRKRTPSRRPCGRHRQGTSARNRDADPREPRRHDQERRAGSTSGPINAGGQSTGLQQLAMDTLWYIDPEQGIDGVWENALAAEKPNYNADFTEMTVKLRDGIFWSDGVDVHRRRPRLHGADPDQDPGIALERLAAAQRRRASPSPTRTPSSSSSRSRTRASTRCSRCAGTPSGSCPSTCSRKPAIR